jgi:UPF0755 protein
MRRDDGDYVRRRRLAVLAVAVIVVLVAGLTWRTVGSSSLGDVRTDGLKDQMLVWWLERQSDDLLPPSEDATPVEFVVDQGESLASISDRLYGEGLIRNATTFTLLARVSGVDRDIQAGDHLLSASMTSAEVLEELQVAAGPSVTVTLLEGWRAEQVVDQLVDAGIADSSQLTELVQQGVTGGGTFPVIPEGASLEGYLFPDTYQMAPDTSAHVAIGTLLDAFAARFTPEMRERAKDAGLSVHEVVTLASIVEREAVIDSERARIAAVFHNRLTTPPYLLDADPTVQYALGYDDESGTWWKRWLLAEDLEVDSSYNTYRSPGLPPGPICSPGLASLEAVLEPEQGDWMYFVANDIACDGSHVFSETWDEHVANVAQYQNAECRDAP